IYDVDGGIYEHDFYTELVKNMLKKYSETEEKENVLIIDDLDRMDPEHTFRILNVLSVNIDPIHPVQNYNKFGFDKIIVVCDNMNLRRIFEHKYGKGVDYNGYIDKYYSDAPFYFDN